MDVNLDEVQLEVRDAFSAMLAAECPPERVRAAEPLGHDPQLWASLRESGVVAMAVPEAQGGDGARLLDLAVIAQLVGRFVAPVPFVESVVAARLLARLGEPAADQLASVLGGSLVSLAVRPAVAGCARLVPAGGVADAVLAVHDGRLVHVPASVGGPRVARTNLGSLPLADWAVGGDATVLADREATPALVERALAEWKVLTAAALTGIALRAHEMGVAFVKQREAFGVPIGAFQSVAHLLADRIAEVDGTTFLMWEAAWTLEEELEVGPTFAAACFAHSAEVAFRTAANSLHVHGGVGYTVEQDIQLYYRRAKAWPLVLGSPTAEYQRVAGDLWGAAAPPAAR